MSQFVDVCLFVAKVLRLWVAQMAATVGKVAMCG
jgi:hypothetical protein